MIVFSDWLPAKISMAPSGRYAHALLEENSLFRDQSIDELRVQVQIAHQDALQHLTDLASNSLDPVNRSQVPEWLSGYPGNQHPSVLMGWFGEIFAGLAAEAISPFGIGWEVPVHLFRFHWEPFEQLDTFSQSGAAPTPLPGRRGDDCIAFERDSSGQIVKSLIAEAKCINQHDHRQIADAHQKVSSPKPVPQVSVLQCIEVLKDYVDDKSKEWLDALRRFLANQPTEYERCDVVSYVCRGNRLRPGSTTWIPQTEPHSDYSGARRLVAIEVRIQDLREFVVQVYSPPKS